MLIWIKNGLNPDEFKQHLFFKKFRTMMVEFLDSVIFSDFSKFETEKNVKVSDLHIIHPCCKSNDYILKKMYLKKNKHVFKLDLISVGKHSVFHKCTFSCYKNYKNSLKLCRHGYGKNNEGKPLIKCTNIKKSGTIKLKRLNRHVNEFNPYILTSCRCNHDIKWIGKSSNDTLACIYYLTNYITKTGISSYNSVLLSHIGFKKTEKFNKTPNNLNENCKRLLSNCINAAIGNTEYSGAIVSNMLLNHGKNGTYYCSHKTICLNLFSIINSFDNNINQMISIETDTKLVSKSTPYSFQKYEYQHRPIEMEDI